jgi:hypothetical protein
MLVYVLSALYVTLDAALSFAMCMRGRGCRCNSAWSRNFHTIMVRYESTIVAMFTGHSHDDEFELFYRDDAARTEAAVINYVGPSATPYTNANPGFRVYEVREPAAPMRTARRCPIDAYWEVCRMRLPAHREPRGAFARAYVECARLSVILHPLPVAYARIAMRHIGLCMRRRIWPSLPMRESLSRPWVYACDACPS